MLVSVAHDFLPKRLTARAAMVMDHFGIGFEQGTHVIADKLDLPIRAGDVVLLTGASGSGKSTLLRAIAAQLDAPGVRIVDVDALKMPTCSLINALDVPVEQAMYLLSRCGLGEAHLMLRTPQELSDGQRYRFRLALAVAQRPQWIVADEFTATLDRTLAKVIAYNVRRIATQESIGFLLATTHEDVRADAAADLDITCRLDGRIAWSRREASSSGGNDKKKEASASPANCGSARRPSATGRTSLGGIIEATTSDCRTT